MGDRTPRRAGTLLRVTGLGTAAVKWVIVALLAVWFLHLFISWLNSTPM